MVIDGAIKRLFKVIQRVETLCEKVILAIELCCHKWEPLNSELLRRVPVLLVQLGDTIRMHRLCKI